MNHIDSEGMQRAANTIEAAVERLGLVNSWFNENVAILDRVVQEFGGHVTRLEELASAVKEKTT